jgi:hypothetical protein
MDATIEQLEKNTPKEMKEVKRWLLWHSEGKGKKPRKVPYYTNGRRRTGSLDSDLDMSFMASFSDAITALKAISGKYSGLGFALGSDGNKCWQGIDLDNVSSNPRLEKLAKSMPGYIEKSPSGNGYHAIGYGKEFSSLGSNKSGIEAYCGGRFFTFTGQKVGGDVSDLSGYVEKTLRPKHSLNINPNDDISIDDAWDGTNWPITDEQKQHLKLALKHIPADDYDSWIKMGFALASISESGREIWIEWSKGDKRYNEKQASEIWAGFKPTRTSYEAVFSEAQRKGWINPLSRKAETPSKNINSRGFRFSPASELLREPKPLRWLIKDTITPESVIFMVGMPSSGKSMMAIDWCCSIATGTDWCEKRVDKGAVVIIAGEGHHGIKKRLKAWSMDREIDLSEAPLVVSDTGADMIDPSFFGDVMAALDKVRIEHGDIALVVVDTLNRNFGAGDENSAKDIGSYLQHIDRIRSRFGSSVLTVHHSGHADGGRARGSSAMRAGTDIEYIVKKASSGDGIVSCEKMKDAPKPENIAFTIKPVVLDWQDADGEFETSAVFDVMGFNVLPGESTKKLEGHLKSVLSALVSMQILIGIRHPTSKKGWRDDFYAACDISNDAREKAFQRSVATLISLGCVDCIDDKYWTNAHKLAEQWPSDPLVKDIVELQALSNGQTDI